MSQSLWTSPAEELLQRTASADPTPGGGSVAAITGAFGLGLILMALAVTEASGTSDGSGSSEAATAEPQRRASGLLARIRPAVDADVVDFTAVMAAYRLPRGDADQRRRRAEAIQQACAAALQTPLALAETLIEVLVLAGEVEPLVKRSIVSDVLAGADLAAGAAQAALRTAEANLAVLEDGNASTAAVLRARLDQAHRALAAVR